MNDYADNSLISLSVLSISFSTVHQINFRNQLMFILEQKQQIYISNATHVIDYHSTNIILHLYTIRDLRKPTKFPIHANFMKNQLIRLSNIIKDLNKILINQISRQLLKFIFFRLLFLFFDSIFMIFMIKKIEQVIFLKIRTMLSSPSMTRHFQAIRNKKINNNNSELLQKSIHEGTNDLSPQGDQIIRVSNNLSKYKLTFGSQFKDCLEPRDQVLQHEFNFSFGISEKGIEDLKDNRLPRAIHENIKKFLVESASNSTSAAFKLLCKGDLTDQQAKQYASKNIFLNTNSIIRETVKGIKTVRGVELKLEDEEKLREILSKEGLSPEQIEHTLDKNWQRLDRHQEALNAGGFNLTTLKRKLEEISFKKQKFVQHLTFDIDNLMSDILVNLADNFPQAPPSGGTPRMRDAIIDLNRLEDQQNDLIFANKIQIGQYIQGHDKNNWQQKLEYGEKDRNYTKFIMDVINTAINVTQSSKDDYKQRTVKEIFNEFNQKLFCLAQQDKFHPIIKSLDQEEKNARDLKEEMKSNKSLVNSEEQHENVVQFFNQTLDRKQKEKIFKGEQLWNQQTKWQNQARKKLSFKQLDMKERLEQFRAKGDKNYAFGQKIPEFIKQFTRQEIANEQFAAKHSSILRILTKWSEYLSEIFVHPEKNILGRSSLFKTIDNQLVLLNNVANGHQKFIRQLKAENEKVKKKYEIIAKNCYRLMGQLLSEQSQASSCVGRYSDTRAVASKINAILTHHMLSYTNVLIHHLLKAGQAINTNYGDRNISLVVFRVSDLLRAKLQCNQSSFISLLKTMYLLDKDSEMKDKFKLVRIKSKLDDPANNIMINYLFMGKVQCELQLSIQQPKGKAKNYYAFSHFVYQLTRGKFGAIAQCAIMISQLDPMIISCKNNYYVQKKGNSILNLRESVLQQSQDSFEKKLKSSVFKCSEEECKRIVINQNQNMFKDEGRQKICNHCIIAKQQSPEEKLKNQKIKAFLKSKELKRMLNFKELQADQTLKYISILSNQGKLAFNVSVFVKEELKTFVVRLDSQIIEQLDVNNLDFSTLDYFDISKSSQVNLKDQQKQQLMFIIKDPAELTEELYQLMDFKTKPSLEKLTEIADEFRKFRLEKALIKTIKFNIGIVYTQKNLQKWQTLGKIAEELAAPPGHHKQRQIILRYRKYKQLNLSSINQIHARSMGTTKQKPEGLTQLPKWFAWMKNLKQATLNGNKLSKITKEQLPSLITHINFGTNNISEFDVSHLANLIKLNLGKNKITAIQPGYFNKFMHIKQLFLQQNQIKEINISDISTLQIINLSQNYLEVVDIINLKSLKQIYIQQNLKPKKMNLVQLSSLITANINRNNLEAIDLTVFPAMKQLFLSSNQLTEVNLSNLKNVTQMYFTTNKLKSIQFYSHPYLKQLNIRQNQLKAINVNMLRSLVTLSLSKNQLQTIDISNLSNLKTLHLYENELKEANFSNLSSLNYLDVSRNKLENIKFANIPCLEKLFLQKNQLKEVDLSSLSSMFELNISENKLEKIDLSHNPNLKYLFISSNLLGELELAELSNLIKLSASKNKLKQIYLSNLEKLQYLVLDNNEISQVDLSNNQNLNLFSAQTNPLVDIKDLPKSINKLYMDRKAIINYDFEGMINLTNITIYNGETKKEELKNLKADKVTVKNQK